jgi:DNA-binding winged helix-turn-helix (wHTH) protein
MKTNPNDPIKLVFRVGGWKVQPHANKLSMQGRTILLEPKVMDVLACLALHAGDVVSQDQLMKAVWPDTFVTRDSLKRCVSVLRRALDDNIKDPQIIETIRKRGYRVVAPVYRDTVSEPVANYRPTVEDPAAQAYPASLLSWFLVVGSLLGLDGSEQGPSS